MAKLRMDLIALEELLFGNIKGEVNIYGISLDDETDIVTLRVSGSGVPEVKEVIKIDLIKPEEALISFEDAVR